MGKMIYNDYLINDADGAEVNAKTGPIVSTFRIPEVRNLSIQVVYAAGVTDTMQISVSNDGVNFDVVEEADTVMDVAGSSETWNISNLNVEWVRFSSPGAVLQTARLVKID